MSTYAEKLARARTSLENKEHQQAVKEYLEALKDAPNDQQRAYIWAEVGVLFYNMGAFDRAIEAIENTLKYDAGYQEKEDLYRLMGFSYSQLGKDEKALDYLQKSAKINDLSEKQQITLYEIAKLHFRQQRYDDAKVILQEIEPYFYQNNKEYWLSVLFYKGFVLYYQNDLAASEQVFEELLENAKDKKRKATALFGLAFIMFQRKQYLNTINLCEAITNHNEQFFDMETLGYLTAASFYHLGRKDVFEKYYQQLVRKYPDGRYREELEKLNTAGNN